MLKSKFVSKILSAQWGKPLGVVMSLPGGIPFLFVLSKKEFSLLSVLWLITQRHMINSSMEQKEKSFRFRLVSYSERFAAFFTYSKVIYEGHSSPKRTRHKRSRSPVICDHLYGQLQNVNTVHNNSIFYEYTFFFGSNIYLILCIYINIIPEILHHKQYW